MRSLLARLANVFRQRRLDRELDSEIAVHLALAAAEREQRGMSREAARRAARREFGGVVQAIEAERDVRGFPLLDRLRAELRDTLRGCRRTPTATVVLILTLAMGIGATSTIFSVVYGVLLKPLPFDEPERLVALNHRLPGFGVPRHGPQSAATYFTYREHARAFEDIGVWNTTDISVTVRDTPERIRALRVSAGVLPLLRIRPLLGTLIRAEDDVPGAPPRVVLTYRYWASAFGATTNVLDRSLTIDGIPHQISGVLPASFIFLNTDPHVVLPARLDRAQASPGAGFGPHGVARLKPGVTIAEAHDDIARAIPLIVEQFPLQPGVTHEMWESVGLAPDIRPLADEVIGDAGQLLWILLAAAGIVLLIVCANVANLLLVRCERRRHEFAVRGALGASGGRIAGALISESLLFGVAGGAVGVLFAHAALGLLRHMAPAQLPRVNEIGIDAVVVVFTLSLAIATALLFAVLPALRFGRLGSDALSDGGRSTSAAPGRHRTRNSLAVAQIALALVLLIVSGLMVRTIFAMREVAPGFVRPAEVQTFRIALPGGVVREPEQVRRTYDQIADRLTQVAGVGAVGVTSRVTMDGPATGGGPFFVKGRPVAGPPTLRRVHITGPGYVEAMGNPVVAGRSITAADVTGRAPSVLITANLAREWFGAPGNAVGQRIGGGDGQWLEIVGVVGDARDDGVNHPAPTIIYVPMGTPGPYTPRNMAFVVRSTRVGTPGFVEDLKRAVQSVNPQLPLANVRTLEEIQELSMASTSFAMTLLGLAAGVALVLALVAVYGVVSYVVAERTKEVGLRIALGAQVSDVRCLLLRHGVTLGFAGIATGITVSLPITPMMSSLLYGVAPVDPATYAGASTALAVVTLVATYLPIHRASRAQPSNALRS